VRRTPFAIALLASLALAAACAPGQALRGDAPCGCSRQAPAAAPVFAPVPDPVGGWSPEVEAMLAQVLAMRPAPGEPPLVATFDFDNTTILGDVSYTFLPYQATHLRYGFDPADPAGPFGADAAVFRDLRAAGDSPDAATLRRAVWAAFRPYESAWEAGRRDEGVTWLAGLLRGLTAEQARALADEAIDQALAGPVCRQTWSDPDHPDHGFTETAGLRLRPAMRRLMDRLRAAGIDVWVVSASPQPAVEAAAARYGVPADHVIAVRTVVHDGLLTAEILRPLPYRQGKADAIAKVLGRSPVLALGDAWTDYEMLTSALHAVLIDRGHDDLKAAVRAKGIPVQPPFADEPVPAPCP
jgi:phosphoserine phosphatase